MTIQEITNWLNERKNSDNIKGMAKFGINTNNAFGIKVEDLRTLAKGIDKNNSLALELWETNIHEARILATIIAEPEKFDSFMLDDWVEDINSWDLCDQFCNNLVCHTEFARAKVLEWCIQDEPFIKRAGFSTMAVFALKNPDVREKDIDGFFGLILNECWDKRNYVRKAVSWALRNIGKRSLHYNRKAVRIAKQMKEDNLKPANETANEALKELQKGDLLNKLKNQSD